MSSLITIGIPACGRTSLLQALNSCLEQDHRPLEIDICDSSPGDEVGRLLRALPLPAGITLRHWRGPPASDASGSLNRLIDRARGERLVILQDDHALLPGAITALDAAYRSNPDVVAAYGIQHCILASGEFSAEDTARHNGRHRRIAAETGIRYDLLVCALWRQIPRDGVLIRSDVARQIAYRDVSEVGLAGDTDFGIRLAMAYRGHAFAFIGRPTSLHRLPARREDGMSGDVVARLYDYLSGLRDLSPAEAQARDRLWRDVAPQAVLEHALGHRRRDAVRVLLSGHYAWRQDLPKTLYHLVLTALPGVRHLRRFGAARRA